MMSVARKTKEAIAARTLTAHRARTRPVGRSSTTAAVAAQYKVLLISDHYYYYYYCTQYL